MMKISILVIEDDKAIQNLMKAILEVNDYECYIAQSGKEAILLAASRKPNVIILDLGLPDMDGVDVIKTIRSWSETPIIVVSARSEDRDKIEALDCGGDDYITKPFSTEELLARIRVAVRKLRYDKGGNKDSAVFVNGGLKIEYESGCVFVDEEETHLTPIEYRLLCLLAKNAGKVLTHTYIQKEIWGSVQESDMASLRVFMANLRKKIEPDSTNPVYIQTHIGVGYRLIRAQINEADENK